MELSYKLCVQVMSFNFQPLCSAPNSTAWCGLNFQPLCTVSSYSLTPLHGVVCSHSVFHSSLLPLGLAGILFPTRSNVVYSGLRIWVAVGLSIGFIIAEVLSVSHRIWFLLIVVLLALASSLGLEIVTRFKLSCYRSYRVNGTSSSI